MANNLGFVAFLCGGVAFVGILVVTAFPEWLRNSQQSSEEYLRNQYVYHGIWWRCTMVKQGTFQCDNYDVSILGLPSDIQACRALMCIASIFSFIGLMASLLSLDCTTMVEPGTKSKNRISCVAGFLFIVAGVCCGGAVSWYAWRVTMEFFNPYYSQREFKYEYGACLYGGWVSMFLALVSGLILTCAACRDLREDSRDSYQPSYSYKPPVSKSVKPPSNKTEYV